MIFYLWKRYLVNPLNCPQNTFHIGQVPIKKYGLKTLLFNKQEITSYNNGMLDQMGEGCLNAQKQIIIKAHQFCTNLLLNTHLQIHKYSVLL